MKYRRIPQIRTPYDLGIAYLGSPHSSFVPVSRKNRIDRAEYGRRLAELEGGVFTPLGYFEPRKQEGGQKYMPHEYTRQRQGRDFALSRYLMDAASANNKAADNIAKAGEDAKTLFLRLEHYKQEAERNAVPVDGHEPPEKGRNLV